MELVKQILENNLRVKYSSDQKMIKIKPDVQNGFITHTVYIQLNGMFLLLFVCLY